jgi:PAS domain S-box-containing protein
MEPDERVNILLVDDNPDNLLALEAILDSPGQNLIKARSGNEALKHILNQDFAVILLDVQMPGMDGFETATLIRERKRSCNVPIIFLTSINIDERHVFKGYSIGGVDYISKPFVPEILRAKVAVFVDLFRKREEIKRQAELVRQLERREHERERALTLEALRVSEEQFRATFQAAAIGMALVDLNGRLMESNPALQSMFGCSRAELCGVFFFGLIHPEDVAEDKKLYGELAKGNLDNYRLENRYNRKDGRLIWGRLTVSLIRDITGSPQFAISMIEDISEQKQAEKELDRRINEQAVVAELGQRALSGIDPFLLMNEIASTVAQTLEVEFCKILELLPDQNTFLLRAGVGWTEAKVGNTVLRTGLDSQLGYVLLLLSNEPVIIEDLRTETRFWTPALLRKHGVVSGMSVAIGGREHPYGVLGAYTRSKRTFTKDDINFLQSIANVLALAIERKVAEEERAQFLAREQAARKEAEAANRIKDEFLAVVSHELRTPVTGILGWAELLNEGGLDEHTSVFALGAILRNANLQVQLIEDLLDVSRIIMGKLRINVRPLELVSIVESAISAVLPSAETKRIQLSRVYDSKTCSITGDPDRLQQVVCNLLSNAIKFTPDGGSVEVGVREADGKVHLTVTDTGVGISQEFLPYVFDRFRQADSTSTRAHGGMGLGLAIARHLVELHGGTVRASSQGEGCGSTFSVELPIAQLRIVDGGLQNRDIETQGSAIQNQKSAILDGLHVVVTDDEADTRDLLVIILKKYGAQVIAVESAAEALQVIEEKRPDLLIADIGMPEEDGYSLISNIRSLPPERGGLIPAIALTAYARAEDRERALLAGYQMHISKPIEPGRLVEEVAELAYGGGKLRERAGGA